MALRDARQCEKTAKSTGERCKNPAVTGRPFCKVHGGKAGAPKGNKNAVTTGEHETIFHDCLDEDEVALFGTIATDLLDQLDEKIRLSDIRIRRMLRRISMLKSAARPGADAAPMSGFDMVNVSESHEKGTGPQGLIDKKTSKSEGVLGPIQRIEEALTRVAREHRQLLATKHQILQAQPPDDDADVSGYLDAITTAAKKLSWPGVD